MTINEVYEKCKDGRNSLLWNALEWCKNEIAKGNLEAKNLLEGGEEGNIYEDFGFFGTRGPHGAIGKTDNVNILFDDEDAFMRYENEKIALLCKRPFDPDKTWEEQHTAVTIEENPRFIKVMDLASIGDFNLSDEEIASIKSFVGHNWRLIQKLGSTTDPTQEDFVDAGDFCHLAILPYGSMEFDGISLQEMEHQAAEKASPPKIHSQGFLRK